MWVPLAFIILFSTGFAAARFGVNDADAFILLLVRSMAVLPLLGLVLAFQRKPAQWGTPRARLDQMGIGMLLHGAYLGGVFAAIQAGLPAGLTALLVSLHPLATAALSRPVFGIQLGVRQWLALLLGALGAALVLSAGSAIGLSNTAQWPLAGLVWCLISLMGMASSTLWQKKAGGRLGMVESLIFQYLGAGIVFLLAATLTQGFNFEPTWRLLLTLAWLVIAISIGAIWLLMLMLQRGEAHQVARLFFLVPPCAAAMAYLFFDEHWTPLMMAGALLVVFGLVLDRPPAIASRQQS